MRASATLTWSGTVCNMLNVALVHVEDTSDTAVLYFDQPDLLSAWLESDSPTPPEGLVERASELLGSEWSVSEILTELEPTASWKDYPVEGKLKALAGYLPDVRELDGVAFKSVAEFWVTMY